MTQTERAELAAGGLLSIGAACEFLSVSRRHLYRLIHTRELPAVKVGSGQKIPRRSCEQYIEQKLIANG